MRNLSSLVPSRFGQLLRQDDEMKRLRNKYIYNRDFYADDANEKGKERGEKSSVKEEESNVKYNLEENWEEQKEDFVKLLKLNGIELDEESKANRLFLLQEKSRTYPHIPYSPRSIGLGASKIRMRLEYRDKELDDFQTISTLGVGSFGKVELVQDKKHPERVFALKVLTKENIVARAQQQHVLNEKKLLISSNSPFIIQLYKTFKNDRYVYLLMEVCLGGELWTVLRDHGRFDDRTTRFFTGCVVEALDYLHHRDIAYRDLKPENLMMDASGYVKLIDFGFAKKVYPGRKTETFCGTPEYAAPEVLLGKGHDCSVDYWALGILIYEMMTGNPPFTGSDTLAVYQTILRGFEDLDFSEHIGKTAKGIIKKLCKDDPCERLGNKKDGIASIRKNKWFKGFKWNMIQNRAMLAPFRPKIKSLIDTSNFDECEASDAVPVEEFSGWDEYF